MKNVMLAVTLVLSVLMLGCKDPSTDSTTLQLKNAPNSTEEIIKDDNSVQHCPSGISVSWCYDLWSLHQNLH
ncbi:MAG: hypothetical protein EAZ67_05140 [Cytophagales bacterium]|nr:MAG: hypothetical protein EAZ67_05140 [Cytophagales bacterium]